jgi:hypothetical protein
MELDSFSRFVSAAAHVLGGFRGEVFQTPLIMMRDVLTDRNGWRDPSNGWLPSSSISRLFPTFAPASLPPTFGSIPTASINGDLKKPCHCLAST